MARKEIGKSSAKKGKKNVSSMDEGMSNMAITKFVVGLIFVFAAIYMLLAFSSFLYSGPQDYSIVDINRFGEFYNDLVSHNAKAANICSGFGARIAFYFINKWFGIAAYIVPVFFALLGLKLIGSFRFRAIRLFILLGLTMIWISLFLSALTNSISGLGESFFYLGGESGKRVIDWMEAMIGAPGIYGILVLVAIFMLVYLSKRTVDVVRSMIRMERILKVGNRFRKNDNVVDNAIDEEESIDAEPDPDTFVDPVTQEIDFNDNDNEDVNEDKDDKEEVVAPVAMPDLFQEPTTQQANEPTSPSPMVEPEKIPVGEPSVAVSFDAVVQKTQQGNGDIKRGDVKTPYNPKLDLEFYKYPPLSLLDKSEDSNPKIDMEEQNANKDRITQVLHSFGVEISSIKATIGPTITLYEITPAEGMRISKIRNLEDDIALSLAAEGIRIIAPIPGKGTIGIEVPNKKKCIVSMESILNSKTYQESTMELPCALGKTITNEVFMVDLAKAPHMLVAGATGMGKSVGLNAIVTSLLYKKHPSELKIVMVDPKKVEFSVYNSIENHFLAKLEEEEEPIITDVQKVVKTLNSLCKLMDTRYDLLKQAGVRNIKEYNAEFKARKLNPLQGHEYMPYYVVIIDEFGDLIMTAGKEIELPICRIAQLARAVGIHMIIATQRPTAQIITGTIKANFPARIAFRVAAMMDSRIILDRPGANQLIGRGDMLYLNGSDPVRVQCAFVDTPEVTRINKFISTQQGYSHAAYLPEPDIDSDGDTGTDSSEGIGHLDPMFEECAKLVVSSQQGSTSMLQRNYSIGYNRAGKIMDQLQKAGIVGAQIGSKPREVLVKDFNTLEQIINSLR